MYWSSMITLTLPSCSYWSWDMTAIVNDVILKGKFSMSMLESNSRKLGAELVVKI
jgi:hypothetical protein